MESRWIYEVHVESIWNLWGSVKYRFNPTLAKQQFCQAFQKRNALSLFQGVFYNADGYTYFMDLDTDWYMAEDVVPNLKKFELFSACLDTPLIV